MKNRFKIAFSKLRFGEHSVPIALLAAIILAFGLLIPRLGIYQDDWVFFYNGYILGPKGLEAFFYYDGVPFAKLVNQLLFNLLGYKPLYWHLAQLFFRWINVTVFWLILQQVWPEHQHKNFAAALVFALHPFFVLQPMAITYLHIWIGYTCLMLSFYWMVLAIQKDERRWLYLVLSVITGVISILTVEYFAGLEFLRPILIWTLVQKTNKNIKFNIQQTIAFWLPYILILGTYIFWRFFVYEIPIDNRNDPIVIKTLLEAPFSAIKMVLFNLFPDVTLIVLTSWYKLLDPANINFTVTTNLLIFGLTSFAAIISYGYLHLHSQSDHEPVEKDQSWAQQAIFFGIVIVVLGLIPPYVGGLFLNQKNALWNSRFGLASMPGAALLVIALLNLLVKSRKSQNILLAVFVGLAVGWHIRYTNDFRRAWDQQINLYSQLLLRAPSINPGTAIFSDGEILSLMGDYPTAYAINTLYTRPADLDIKFAPTWFFVYTTNFSNRMDEVSNGMELFNRHRSVIFKGQSRESLVITFEPGQGQCLHVIRPEDKLVRTLPASIRDTADISRISRIYPESQSSLFLEHAIGYIRPNDWCSHYQRADLARQLGNWNQVIAEWNSAQALGLEPNDSFEYIPFIEAFIHQEQSDKAVELSFQSAKKPAMQLSLCDMWNAWVKSMPGNANLSANQQKIEEKFQCLNN